jgi:hypothetical protein
VISLSELVGQSSPKKMGCLEFFRLVRSRMGDTLFKKRTSHDACRRRSGLVLTTIKDVSDESKSFDIDWFLIVKWMDGSQSVI